MGRHKTLDDEALLEVARRVFREKGHSATTRDVSRAAGLSQSVLYQRFPSKDELFFAAMLPAAPDVEAMLGEVTDTTDASAYLREVSRRILTHFEQITPAILHVITHPSFTAERMMQAHEKVLALALVQGLTDRFRRLEQGGKLSPIDPQAAAETLIAALHSASFHQLMLGGLHKPVDDERLQRMVEVLARGILRDE